MSSPTPFPPQHRRSTRRTAFATLVVSWLLVLLLAGCGQDSSRSSDGRTERPTERPAVETVLDPTTTVPAPAPGALVVRSDHDVTIFTNPVPSAATRSLPARNSFGSPLALLVTTVGEGDRTGWLQVLLPGRPNGATGWVQSDQVELRRVLQEVRVDLAARTLQVLVDDAVILTTPVSVGEPGTPTPPGRFSLTDKLDTGDVDGPYGPFALGLSARSDSLTEFAGGDAQVGIHGTNDPSSIGRAASHGCIRVPNDVARQLSDLLPLGTPVIVA